MDIDNLFSCEHYRVGYLDPMLHAKLGSMMIKHGRLHQKFLDSQMYKDYIYQFIFGFLFSIPHDPESKNRFVVKDVYYRSLDDNIRVFSVIGNKYDSQIEGIHLHSFFTFSVTGEQGSKGPNEMPNFSLARGMTKLEYQRVESLLKQAYGVQNIASVPITVFEYDTTTDTRGIWGVHKLPENIHGEDWAPTNFKILSNHAIVLGSQQHEKFYNNLYDEPLNNLVDAEILHKIPTHDQQRRRLLAEFNAELQNFVTEKHMKVFMEHAFLLYKSHQADGSIKVGETMPHFRTSQAAMCGFLHGVLSATGGKLEQFYVKHQLNNEANDGQGFFYLEIRPPQGTKSHLVVDFSLENSRESFGYSHYHSLKNKDSSSSLSLIRIEPVIKQDKQFRVKIDSAEVKFSFANILGDFIQHLQFKDETESAEVFKEKLIRGYLGHMFSTSSFEPVQSLVGKKAPIMTHFKYFLLGALRAMPGNKINGLLKVGKNTESNSDFDCIMLSSTDTRVTPNLVLKFDKERPADRNFYKKQNLISNHRPDTIILHFYDNDKTKFSIDYTSQAEATKNLDLEEINSIDIKNVFKILEPFYLSQYLNNKESNVLPEHVNPLQLFHEGLKTILEDTEQFDINDKLSVSEYLNGVFTHFPDVSISPEGETNDITKVITLKSKYLHGKSEVALNFKFDIDANSNVVESVIKTVQSFDAPKNNDLLTQVRLTIVYNQVQKNGKNLAIIEPNHNIFNTKNVHEYCGKPARKRRTAFNNPCSLLYTENNENTKGKLKETETKVDYSMLDSSLNEIPKFSDLRIHIGKIYTASSKLQMGFIARDIVADSIHGDIKGVARDALFFGGAMLADRAGVKLVEKGASLVSKGWKLAGYAATSVGKCLPKIGFDIYMGYQLYTEVKNNNTVGIAMDGAMIGIDLLECSLEALAAFGVIALSPVVGEVALIASTIMLVGVNIYDAVKNVEHIDEFVHLNAYERGMEGICAFLHLDPEPSIVRLMEEVQANELIMKQILSKNKNFKRFVVNSGILKNETMISIIENNKMDFRQKYALKQSRATPRSNILEINNVKLFCEMDSVLQGEESEVSFGNVFNYIPCLFTSIFTFSNKCIERLDSSYLCQNAFGFERYGATEDDRVLHILGDGDDVVLGFPNSPNTFSLGNGKKRIFGGQRDDTFVLFGNATYGILNGTSQGNNILDLSDYANNQDVLIGQYVHVLSEPQHKFYISGMTKIVGRKNSIDWFHYVDCNVKEINMQGGEKEAHDMVIIPYFTCPSVNLTVSLAGYTSVSNRGKAGVVTFVIPYEFSMTNIKIDNKNIKNKIIFPHDFLSDIKINLTFNKSIDHHFIKIQICEKKTLSVRFPVGSDTTFLFRDNSTMTLKGRKLVAMLQSDMPLFDLIDSYDDLVIENPDLTVIAHSTSQSEAIVFNHEGITVEDPPGVKRHINLIQNHLHHNLNLIGHPSHQNYFFITNQNSNIQTLNDFFIGQIKIHCPRANNMTNIIDLHAMARQLFSQTEGFELNITVEIELADIILTLHALNSSTGLAEVSSFGQIRIVNAIVEGQDINYDLYVYGENRFEINSLQVNGTAVQNLELRPKNHYTNKTLLIVSPGSIERYTLIVFSNWRFYKFQTSTLEFYKMKNTLIMTNVANPQSEEYSTIVFSDYYLNEFKYQTLSIIYEDPIIEASSDPMYLSSFKEKIDVASDIKELWMKLNYEIYMEI